MNDNQKFRIRFCLFTIGQLFLVLGTFTIGARFKVVPSWLSLFFIFSAIGFVLIYIAFITLYKVNRNYLRSFIAFIIYLIITIFADACSQSKSDFYLIWSRGLGVSADFLLCIMYVYLFLGTRDYFHERNYIEGRNNSKLGAIILIILFAIERTMAFIASLNATKLNYILYSICRFGSWGFQFIINIFIFVVLLIAYIHLRKQSKEELTNEEKA